MTVWSIPQIAAFWINNGGNRNAVVYAVSIALAESGGDDHAISPSSDYGLYQINSINWSSHGINDTNWMNPNTSTSVAIQMSGNGTNWAAWCTAWANPAGNCGHGWLPVPQNGSAAGSHVAQVAAVLGQHGIPTSTPAAPPSFNENWPQPSQSSIDLVNSTWRASTTYFAVKARSQWAILDYLDQGTRRI